MGNGWWRAHGGQVAAAALLVLGTMDLVQHYGIDPTSAAVFSAARTAPLLIHRTRPLSAWWLTVVAVTAVALVGVPVSAAEPWPWAVTSIVSLTVAAGVVGAQGRTRFSAAMVAVLGAGLLGVFPERGDWLSVVLVTVLCAMAAVVGDARRGRDRVAAELGVERERRALVEERSRIARELHDVVAHHMSLITVQAESARYRLPSLPSSAAEEFTGIAALARGSLAELRGLLSVLRDSEAASHAPQPDLAGLADLVERTNAAGTPVRLVVSGALGSLSQVVQLSAYRIVQESLSNVVRHAPGAATSVTVVLAGTLVIEVANQRPAALPVGTGPGYGLIGLRERATLLGGTLEVTQPGGGWLVRAVLPG